MNIPRFSIATWAVPCLAVAFLSLSQNYAQAGGLGNNNRRGAPSGGSGRMSPQSRPSTPAPRMSSPRTSSNLARPSTPAPRMSSPRSVAPSRPSTPAPRMSSPRSVAPSRPSTPAPRMSSPRSVAPSRPSAPAPRISSPRTVVPSRPTSNLARPSAPVVQSNPSSSTPSHSRQLPPSTSLSKGANLSKPPSISNSISKAPAPRLETAKSRTPGSVNSHLSGIPAHTESKQPSRATNSPRVSPNPSVASPRQSMATGLSGGLTKQGIAGRSPNATKGSSNVLNVPTNRSTALAPRPTQKVAAARPHAAGNRAQIPPSHPLRASRPVTTHLAPTVAVGRSKGNPATRAAFPARLSPPVITTAANHNLYRPQHGTHVSSPSNRYGHWSNYGVWRGLNHGSFQSSHNHHGLIYPTLLSSVNYALLPRYWGSDPWWSCGYTNSWYHGSWNYGWNRHWHHRYAYYRRPLFYYPPGYDAYYSTSSSFVPWGLASWTLGRLAYDTGYYSYYNPYPASPVIIDNTVIRYTEPVTSIASDDDRVRTDEEAKTVEQKAAEAMDRAREAFRVGDYVTASTAIDEAISHTPGNSVFHEFRALVLFSLGRYAAAAGVLHSVLASGPGWDWETMIGFYGDPAVYTGQFRKLENYVVGNPESASSRLLLGYHYMVGGSLAEATEMFDQVVDLQPRDTVAAQIRSLLRDSDAEAPTEKIAEKSPTEDAGGVPTEEADKAPISKEALTGIWKAQSAAGKAITLSLTSIGTFSWEYEGTSGKVLKGEWSLDKDGLLVLSDEDVQMVGDIALNSDGTLHFLMAGSPDGDPGLTFKKE